MEGSLYSKKGTNEIDRIVNEIFFEEDDVSKFDSRAYIIQDCDLFVQFLLKIKEQRVPKNLPKQIKFDSKSLIERNIIVVFHLLESLKRTNIRRLFERGLD